MGLKSSKKPAMVLILILMIITSLSIFIIGAMKILTTSDEEFSINRNASGGTGTKMLGKFICYKKADGKVYQQRVEYKTDGSIKFHIKETPVGGADSCTFEIPKGVRSYEVSVIGGGGAGASTSQEIKYIPVDEKTCFNDNLNSILEEMNAVLVCTNKYRANNGKTEECTSCCKYNSNDVDDRYYGKYSIQCSNTKYATMVKKIKGVMKANGQPACGSSNSGTIMYPSSYKCHLYVTYQTLNGKKIRKIPIPVYDGIQFMGTSEVNNMIISTIKKDIEISCRQKNPVYEVTVGLPGSPGKVTTTTINSAIYGSSNGGDKIEIKKEQIGSGGKAPVSALSGSPQNGGQTTFEYWYKNSKQYIKQSIPKTGISNGGQKGSTNKITIYSKEQAETIESKEGEGPASFSLPSVFKFGELHSGYYDGNTKENATNFGSSGASGYVSLEPSRLDASNAELNICISATCNYTSHTFSYPSSPGYETARPGTDGAGGAILISW